jgi:hypothetical protein
MSLGEKITALPQKKKLSQKNLGRLVETSRDILGHHKKRRSKAFYRSSDPPGRCLGSVP